MEVDIAASPTGINVATASPPRGRGRGGTSDFFSTNNSVYAACLQAFKNCKIIWIICNQAVGVVEVMGHEVVDVLAHLLLR